MKYTWIRKAASAVQNQVRSGFRADLAGASAEPALAILPSAANKHVDEYLAYYADLKHAPNYAVLVNGAWGIGKTFLVKAFLRRKYAPTPEHPQRKTIYVSLYGLSSLSEIDSALLQAMYPLLGHKVTRIAGRVAQTLMRYKGVSVDVDMGDILNRTGAEIYVFDDLERCRADLNAVLGYINEFVEHDDCKVIIIANDAEIYPHDATSRTTYERSREKIIGKILEVQSAFPEAFGYFCSLIDAPRARELFSSLAVEIASLYSQSALNNLRILQQTMWDFERLSGAFTEKHWSNSEATRTLLSLIFALSFELKSGRIALKDVLGRKTGMAAAYARISRDKKTHEQDAIELAESRYPEVDLTDTILSNDLLGDVLARGIIDAPTIQDSLNKSRFFVDPANEPAWRTVWSYYERTDDQFEQALVRMESQFTNREFREPGEVLQVVGLRLFLSKIGIIKKTRAEVVQEAKLYIENMFTRSGETTPFDHFGHWDRRSYDGLGMHEHDTPEFDEVYKYFDSKNSEAVQKSYPGKAEQLLGEMTTDPSLYYRRLCLTNSNENIYYDVPILSYIDPNRFVDTLLGQHPSHQKVIMMAFKTRYEHGALLDKLKLERDWLERVRDILIQRAAKLPDIGKYRLFQNIEWNIAPTLPSMDEGATDAS